MLVVTGIFENERFIPDRPITIPQKKKVTVTIDDETDTKLELEKAADILCYDYELEKLHLMKSMK